MTRGLFQRLAAIFLLATTLAPLPSLAMAVLGDMGREKYRNYWPVVPGTVTLTMGTQTTGVGIAYTSRATVGCMSNGIATVSYAYPTNRNYLTNMTVDVNGSEIFMRSIEWDSTNQRIARISYTVGGTEVAGYVYTFASNADRVVSNRLADASWWAYEYDPKGQLLSGRRYHADGSPYYGMRFGYAYDEIGNVLQAGPEGYNGVPVHRFEANDLNLHVNRVWSNRLELVGRAITNATVTINDVRAFRQGDAFSIVLPINTVGQALRTNLTAYAVWYDGTNDVVKTVTGELFLPKTEEPVEYRDTGSMLSESRFSYRFNSRDNLVAIHATNVAPSFSVTMDYYADGRRATKRLVSAGVTNLHQFIYDRWNLVHEKITQYRNSGTTEVRRDYLWGLDMAGWRTGKLGQDSGGIGGLVAIQESNASSTNLYFPLCDANGNVHNLLDTNGVVVGTYAYSPFGVLVGMWGEKADVCPFRFMSKYYDSETELYYYGYRYYDARTCKWLSLDPLGERGGVVLTGFCRNDPVNFSDPLGLEAWGKWFEEVSQIATREVSRWNSNIRSPTGAGVLGFWSEWSARTMGIIGSLDLDYSSKRLAAKLIKANELQRTEPGISSDRAAYNAMQLTLNPMTPLVEAYDKTSYQPDDFGRQLATGEAGERFAIGTAGTAGTVAYVSSTTLGTISSVLIVRNTIAAKNAGNLATTALSKTVTGVADDALVHFSPETYSVVKPGAGGQLFTFRYGDIKHLTPRQLETVIGPLSKGGQTGGASVMHVLESGLGRATKTPGAVVTEIPEYILSAPSRATGMVIVQ